MLLNILIPTLKERKKSFKELYLKLTEQIIDCDAMDRICIKSISDDRSLSIGTKRNYLLDMANADYICFIDDDDTVSSNYISKILEVIPERKDCISLRGIITWDGTNPEIFEHSIRYKEYRTASPTSGIRYERYPNHLNVIKTSIAKQFKFPEINHGEDTDWATQIFNSGLIKTESYISDVIYHYQYKNK